MRTPRDPSFAIVSWVIQWRRGPQDAQVGLKLASFLFWLLTFQKPTFNIVCLLAPFRLLPTPGCDPTAGLAVVQIERESGCGFRFPRFWCASGDSCSSVHFLCRPAAQIWDIHKEEAPKDLKASKLLLVFSSSKLTKINLDFYLGPFPFFLYSIVSSLLFVCSSASLFTLHFLSSPAPSTLSLVPFLYWVVLAFCIKEGQS